MKTFKKHYISYLIMFFLLGVSGIPYFSSSKTFEIVLVCCLLLLFLYKKGQVLDIELLYISLAILICVLFQSLIFSYFKAITIIGLFLKIFAGYLSVKLLGKYFTEYFIHVMIFFAILSFLIFIPIFIKPDFLNTLIDATPSFFSYQYELWGNQIDNKTLIFYNLQVEQDHVRNCGPFWEPAAFGGYLIIALMFNTIKKKTILNKINWLFIITIISTQSTTAYLALFVFIVCYIIFNNYSLAIKFLIIFLGIAGYIAYQNIPFLGDKIKEEANTTQDAIESVGGDTRMASALLDLEDIKKYPFTGRGVWPETRVDKKFEFAIRNNGLTNFIAIWGLFFFFYYFYWYYKSFSQFCKLNNANRYMPIVLLVMIWLISFSENYYNSQFFWSFVFIHIPLRNLYSKEPHPLLAY